MEGIADTAGRPGTPPDDDIDLFEYVGFVWRHRWLILVSTVSCAAVAFLAGTLTRPMYPATATLLLKPRPAEAGEEALTLPTFKAIVQAPSLVGKVVGEHKLTAHGVADGADLLRFVSIDQIPDTNFVAVTVRLPDPHVAAAAANLLGELAVEAARDFGGTEGRLSSETLEAEVREASANLERAATALEAVKRPVKLSERELFQGDTARRAADYRIAEDLYVDAAKRLQQRRMRLAALSGVARLQDRAVVPGLPIPKYKVRTATVAGLAGQTLSALGALSFELFRRARRSRGLRSKAASVS